MHKARLTFALTTFLGCAACGGSPRPAQAPPAAADDALRLDGVGASMTAPCPEPDPFTAEATVSAWVRADVLPSKAGRIFHIAGKSGFARDLDLQVEPDDHFHFYVATGAPHTAVSTTKIVPGTWFRVDATYHAKEAIVLYVNRVAEATVPIPGITREPNTGPITVGENATFHGRFFQGSIDDVTLRSRALTAAEVTTVHMPKGPETGLVAAYSFDGDAKDSSGLGTTVSSLVPRASKRRAHLKTEGRDELQALRVDPSLGELLEKITARIATFGGHALRALPAVWRRPAPFG